MAQVVHDEGSGQPFSTLGSMLPWLPTERGRLSRCQEERILSWRIAGIAVMIFSGIYRNCLCKKGYVTAWKTLETCIVFDNSSRQTPGPGCGYHVPFVCANCAKGLFDEVVQPEDEATLIHRKIEEG